jgi:CDP-glucose 4,6-dehydratase
MNHEFFRGKKVLITGVTGFKGSWLSLWLQQLGAQVIGYALAPPTTPSLFSLAQVAEGMTTVIGDIRNLELLQATLKSHQPEIVIHLAAQPLVRYSYEHPVETFQTNIMGGVHILEAIRQCSSVRAALIITSDKCYENQEWPWAYRETETVGGHDPYSSSKACVELITSAYRRSFIGKQSLTGGGVALGTARAGNVIGGGDWAADRLVPDIMKSFLQEETVQIRSPNAIRPWQHVLEPLNGYLTLVEKLWSDPAAYSEAWNFGPAPHCAQTVAWLVKRLSELWGPGANWKIDASPQPYEAHYLKLDSSKARFHLNWEPQLDLDSTLKWITDWYLAYRDHGDLRKITESQIQQFQTLERSCE